MWMWCLWKARNALVIEVKAFRLVIIEYQAKAMPPPQNIDAAHTTRPWILQYQVQTYQ
jgi:hypothetical protein